MANLSCAGAPNVLLGNEFSKQKHARMSHHQGLAELQIIVSPSPSRRGRPVQGSPPSGTAPDTSPWELSSGSALFALLVSPAPIRALVGLASRPPRNACRAPREGHVSNERRVSRRLCA